jgi:RNA polymerase sigma-70 factor, ECF subfamily
MIQAALTGEPQGLPAASAGLVPRRPGFPWPTRDTVSDSAMPAPDEAASAKAALPTTAHDRVAERALYEQHVDRIFRLALRMTGSTEMAEDLTQDVFMRAFDRLHQFRGESGLGTWLHRVAITVILNAIAKRKTAAAREVPLDPTALAPSRSGAIELDVRDRVRAAVAQLPEELRVVVLLYDVEGYQHNEIADLMGISAGACRMRLLRAHQLLRTMLPLEREEWGGHD